MLQVNIVIMFSAPPLYQVMNAKKKLKKKRYINSGTVSRSSEIRACTCLHGAGCRVQNIQRQTLRLSRWGNICVIQNGTGTRDLCDVFVRLRPVPESGNAEMDVQNEA